MIEILSELKNIKLFSNIPLEQVKQLAALVEPKTYKKGELLFIEGEPARGLFYILRGSVQMSKTSIEGKHHILQIFGRGEVLAEAVLFSDAPYPATAEALESTEVYFISVAGVTDLILEQPSLALYIIQVLSERLRSAQEKLKAWAFAGANERVARLLLELAVKHGKPVPEGIIIDTELTHGRLAALLGFTRETVSRVISGLRTEGLIVSESRKITITDVERLERYADN